MVCTLAFYSKSRARIATWGPAILTGSYCFLQSLRVSSGTKLHHDSSFHMLYHLLFLGNVVFDTI